MKYHGITFGFFALAIGAYILGTVVGATLFVVFGLGAEAIFWIRLLRRRHATVTRAS